MEYAIIIFGWYDYGYFIAYFFTKIFIHSQLLPDGFYCGIVQLKFPYFCARLTFVKKFVFVHGKDRFIPGTRLFST